MRHRLLLALLLALSPLVAGATPVTYSVLVDTSSLSGTTGSLDFNFEPGPYSSQAATVQVSAFGGGGAPLGGAALSGDAVGSLPGALSLNNGTGFNDYFQAFTFGSTVSFNIALSGPALDSPSLGSSGSTFAFSIFSDSNGTLPALITDTNNGYAITLDINADGSTTLRNYTTSVTPELPTGTLVATALLFAACLRHLAALRRRMVECGRDPRRSKRSGTQRRRLAGAEVGYGQP